VLEEGTPWATKAELYIGIIKEAVQKDMKASDCPIVFWDYCVKRRARINNLTAKDNFKLHGSNAYTLLTGAEGDISNMCQYGWYDWCYYREQKAKFPFNREVLGRVLGPANGEGNEMAQWIIKPNGNVVPCRTVRPLQVDEVHSPTEIKEREIFDELIERRWGTSINWPKVKDENENENDPNKPHPEDWDYYEDDDKAPRTVPNIEDIVDSKGKLLDQQPAYDRLINSEVQLQLGEELYTAKVIQRVIGPDGTTVGEYDDNSVMNSIVYEVDFPDSQVKEYSANVIAENMLTQVDSDGFSTSLMDAIVDYRRDDATAVQKADAFVVTHRGQKKQRKTTCEWQLLIQWKDGGEQWIHLKGMKESHLVEVAEFATARGIADEPAFCWWILYTLRKRDMILSAVKSRIRWTTHKYGIELHSSAKHTDALNTKNGNTFWRDATKKEMHNVGVAFEVLGQGEHPPPQPGAK
jgi:hypothetical protein